MKTIGGEFPGQWMAIDLGEDKLFHLKGYSIRSSQVSFSLYLYLFMLQTLLSYTLNCNRPIKFVIGNYKERNQKVRIGKHFIYVINH